MARRGFTQKVAETKFGSELSLRSGRVACPRPFNRWIEEKERAGVNGPSRPERVCRCPISATVFGCKVSRRTRLPSRRATRLPRRTKFSLRRTKTSLATHKVFLATEKVFLVTNKISLATNKTSLATNKGSVATEKTSLATDKGSLAARRHRF